MLFISIIKKKKLIYKQKLHQTNSQTNKEKIKKANYNWGGGGKSFIYLFFLVRRNS